MATSRVVLHRAALCLFFGGLAAAATNARHLAHSDCPRGTLPAYAHNDYLNAHPLDDALSLGYQGAEADVFLVAGKLQLGHERRAAVKDGSLEALYLAPLREIVARCGTLTGTGQPFLLNLEIKEESRATFDTLVALLARYPDLFSRDTGQAPVQAVLVGWYPAGFRDSVSVPVWRQSRLLHAGRPPTDAGDRDVGLISFDYEETIGKRWQLPAQRRRWLSAIRATKAEFPVRRIRALHVPVNERVYRDLLAAGVDLIGTLELAKSARLLEALDAEAKNP